VDRLTPLLVPHLDELMNVAKANPLVNNPRNQGPEQRWPPADG
jgi:hypothetical protein